MFLFFEKKKKKKIIRLFIVKSVDDQIQSQRGKQEIVISFRKIILPYVKKQKCYNITGKKF